MKAIILAAGYGNRMRPLTDAQHKTLLMIGDRSIITRLIDGLVDGGVTEIIIVTGYRAEELTDFLKTAYASLRFQFVHNDRFRETNNIFSLALAFEKAVVDDDVVLIESDLIFDPAVLRRALESRHANVALVDRFRSGMDGTVVAVHGDVVTSVIPPHLQDSNFDFSDKYKTLNIYKFSRDFCEHKFKQLLSWYARAIDDNCYYELILGILIYMQQETIHAEILDGELWAEVDDPNDLRVAEFSFCPERRLEILEESFGGYWAHDIVDFCFIRNMYFPTAAMLSELRNALPTLLQNYGSRQTAIDQKLAYFLLLPAERVIALDGASQAYPLLAAAFAGRRVAIPNPTFGEYPRLFPQHVIYRDDGLADTSAVSHAVESADVIVVVSPNNPTGTTLPTAALADIVRRHPDRTFLVDESFIAFSEQPSIVPLIEREGLKNVVVLTSLSKVLGVPGVRLGYLYSHDEEFLSALRSKLPIWGMNSIAEHFLEIILKHRRSLDESFVRTRADREEFRRILSTSSCVDAVLPSGGNYVLARLKGGPHAASSATRRLLTEDRVYVKDVSAKMDDGAGYLRLAVRFPAENAALAVALERILG